MLTRVGRDLAAAVVPAREIVLKAVVCEPVFCILLRRARRRKGVVLFGVARIGVAILTAVACCVDEPYGIAICSFTHSASGQVVVQIQQNFLLQSS